MPPAPDVFLGDLVRPRRPFVCPVYTLPWPHGEKIGVVFRPGDEFGPISDYELSEINQDGDQYFGVCVKGLGWINIWTRMNLERQPVGVNFATVESKALVGGIPFPQPLVQAPAAPTALFERRRCASDVAMPRPHGPLPPQAALAVCDERIRMMVEAHQ